MKLLLAFLPIALLIAALYAIVKVLEARKSSPGARTPAQVPLGDPQLEPASPPYEPRRALLSDAELRFLPALEQAVNQVWDGSARIFVQVPMAAVLQVARGLDNSARQRWYNQIDRKTFDFVITDARTKVLACVELDDSSHDGARRRERDEFVNRACTAAGLHLARIPGAARYDSATVAQTLALHRHALRNPQGQLGAAVRDRYAANS